MKPATGQPAVVLLSGGLDSAVAAACARRDGFGVHALSFDYGQRHGVELEAARRVAEHLGAAEHRVVRVDLRAIGGSALTAEIPVPKDRTREEIGAGVPPTYVPARNLVFLSVAAGYAQTIGARDVFFGANCLDYSGYPDCRWPFISAFIEAANLACGLWDDRDRGSRRRAGFTVHAPLINLTKAQIIRLGRRMGVDLSITHSCYDPDESGAACGRCDSCQIRRRGFEEAGVPDPTRYAATVPAG
jgi:7-cyano-7-deazaguanine synthase